MKECKDCQEVKPLDNFGTRKGGRYIRTACKPCYNAKLKSWRDSKLLVIDGVERRGVWLRMKYGISLEEYQQMYEAQNGRCAICYVYTEGVLLVVDHNHNTGAVRALLCQPCNKALGFAKEDPETLRSMASYLEAFND